jgi:predicted nucleic acid-binding protein
MKARVVLDANVLVNAVLNPSSNPAHILELVRQEAVQLLVSSDTQAPPDKGAYSLTK